MIVSESRRLSLRLRSDCCQECGRPDRFHRIHFNTSASGRGREKKRWPDRTLRVQEASSSRFFSTRMPQVSRMGQKTTRASFSVSSRRLLAFAIFWTLNKRNEIRAAIWLPTVPFGESSPCLTDERAGFSTTKRWLRYLGGIRRITTHSFCSSLLPVLSLLFGSRMSVVLWSAWPALAV